MAKDIEQLSKDIAGSELREELRETLFSFLDDWAASLDEGNPDPRRGVEAGKNAVKKLEALIQNHDTEKKQQVLEAIEKYDWGNGKEEVIKAVEEVYGSR